MLPGTLPGLCEIAKSLVEHRRPRKYQVVGPCVGTLQLCTRNVGISVKCRGWHRGGHFTVIAISGSLMPVGRHHPVPVAVRDSKGFQFFQKPWVSSSARSPSPLSSINPGVRAGRLPVFWRTPFSCIPIRHGLCKSVRLADIDKDRTSVFRNGTNFNPTCRAAT
jgi:hypothetical protein